jgi:uncharacterized phiE125 gp8 family phage protein
MSFIQTAGPPAEPLSLDEAKAFLRIEHNDDDQVIAALIAGARIHVETQAQLAMMTQSWRVVLDRWPKHGRVAVRPAPLKALTAARVYDFAGNAQPLDTQAFVPDIGASMLAFVPWAVPAPTRIAAGIELDVTVGFGDATTDVPEPLRQAVRLLVAHWYENRGLAAAGTQRPAPPASVPALIAPYRMLSL